MTTPPPAPAKPRRSHGSPTRNAYAMLVALASEPLTVSELQSRIIGDTTGVYVRDNSLRSTLQRYVESGVVTADGHRFALTPKGRRVLTLETQLLEALTRAARKRLNP